MSSVRIQVINPNTSLAMTETIGAAARAVAAPGTEILAVCPRAGVPSIEGHFDEAIAAVGVLEQIRAGREQGVDGHVIACFGDPGLLAARELAQGPVIGIAEAAMHMATMVATRFSIVTTLPRTLIIARLKDSFDVLYAEGETAPKMMSVGMHCRLLGRPGRFRALQRFLDYIQQHDKVWVCTRQQIADHWRETHPYRG